MKGATTSENAGGPTFEQLEARLLLNVAPLADSVRLPADWTVMVYLDADNNLEGAGIDDVNEMEVVGSSPSVNILVQLDRISGHDTSNGNWTDTRRGRVVHDTNTSIIGTPLTSIGEANMGAPGTLSDFIQWGVSTYPADHYATILWDHGGGTSGVCWDDTSNDNLTVAEVGQALLGAGVQMDIVGFDACLMGMMEQAYEIRDYADIMVASEQTEPWDGWPYDTFLADLVGNPTQPAGTLASSIVTRYGQSYGGAETLSAVDVPAAQSLAGDLDAFAGTVIAEDTDWAAISAARTGASYFTDTDYRDLGTFIDGVGNYASNPNIIAAAQTVQTTYASAVISNHSGPAEGATGLSIYLPAQGGTLSSSYSAANFDLLADTQWDEFLQAFTGSSGGGGTDLDGSIFDAGAAGSLPAAVSGFVGLDGVEDVGGRDVDFYSVPVVTGQQIGFDIDAREMGGSLDSVLRLFDSNGVELDMNDDAYDPDTNQYSYDSYIDYTFTKAETVYIAVSGYSNWSYDPWTTGSGTSGSTGSYDLLIRTLGEPVTDVNGTIPTATGLGSAPVSYSAAIGDEPIGDKDVDFYAVDVESNQGLTMGVVSGGSGLDAYLKLFAGDGTLLASDDNTNGVDPEIDYDFSALGAGTYYVAVSGVPNTNYDPFALGSAVSGSTGGYTLTITGYSVHLDFDGVIPRANDIGAPPADVTGSIGDEPVGSLDVDFYAVSAAAGQTIGFDIDAQELGYALDAELRLFDPSGNELAFSDDGTDPDSGLPGSDPYIEYTFAAGGTYYIAVSGAPNDVYSPFVEGSGVPGDQGDYELHVRHVGAGNDLNGTIPTAVPAGALPATMVGSVGDEPAGALDVDFHAVDVLAGQRLGFDIDARDSGSSLDSMLRLFDDGGNQLAGNDDATDPDTGVSSYDSYLTYQFSAGGTYYIAVSGYLNDQYDPFVAMSGTAGSTGDYELLIREIAPGPQNQIGPDGFGYVAYPVTPAFEDIGATGSAELTPYVDDDYFHLSAANLAGFEFDFYGVTYQDLYVSSNGLITFGSGSSAYSNTDLTMSPSQAAIAPYWDDLVVDDSSDAAVLWEVRGSGDEQRLIIQWNDIHYIAGWGMGQVTFQAVLDETDDSMEFNYLDLASSSWHAEGASATVGIRDAGSQSVGAHVLQISVDGGPNNFVGTGRSTRAVVQQQDDAYEEQEPYTLPENTWLSSIAGPGIQWDDDWYEINVSPSDHRYVFVELTFTDALGDIDLELCDDVGTVIDGSYSVTDNEYIETVVPSAGTYYLRAYPPGAATGNTYDLWWDDLMPPSLSIDDVSQTEGDSGTTDFDFTVTLAAPPGLPAWATGVPVTVDYATADGTAASGGDYTAASGTLTFNPGQTSKTVSVSVIGETTYELNETFFVNLSNASGAMIGDGQGSGTILNDDTILPGDVNADGNADNLDITPFIAALVAADEAAFLAQYPGGWYWAADCHEDGNIDNLDITPFVAILAGGGAETVAAGPQAASLDGEPAAEAAGDSSAVADDDAGLEAAYVSETFEAGGDLVEQWARYVPSGRQTDISVRTSGRSATSQVVLAFPDAGFRVGDWGWVARSSTFSADAQMQRRAEPSMQVITSIPHDRGLGRLAPGDYWFTFMAWG